MSNVPADGYYVIQNYEYNNIWGVRPGFAPEHWVVGYTSGTEKLGPDTTIWKLTRDGPGFTLMNVHLGLYLVQSDQVWRGKVVAQVQEAKGHWDVFVGPHPGTFKVRGYTSKTGVLEITENGADDFPIVISDNDAKAGTQLFRFCVVAPPTTEAKAE